MAWTYDYDITTPASTDDPKDGDDRLREIKAAFQERMAKDHYFPLTGNSEVSNAAAGEHKKVTLRVRSSAPTPEADKGYLYTKKDVDNKAELHWMDEDSHELQLVSKGVPLISTSDPGDYVNGMIWIE